MKVLINGYLHTMRETGAAADIPNGFIAFENGKITDIGSMDSFTAPANAEVIDVSGAHISPGLIDAHCHIGMWEDSVDFEGADGNEDTDPITPHLRAVDSVNPLDRCFKDAQLAGITTVVTGPGSSNVMGGQFAALKTYGCCVDEMIIKSPIATKFSLGENPKSTYHNKNQTPVTRMAIAALLRETLYKAVEYKSALDEYNADPDENDKPEFDIKLESLLPLLNKEIHAKVHAHRADDIATAVRIAKEFDIRITIEHCTEGHLIPHILKNNDIPVMAGPALCERCKVELRQAGFENYKKLTDAGLSVAIITDHPVVPIEYLSLCASLAVKSGMDKHTALEAITINAAKNCGIDDTVGSLTVGKDADIAVFSAHPLDFESKILHTFINGIDTIL